MIGKRADRREGEPWTVDQLLSDMKAFGITDAIVTHALSRDYDAITGNREIAELVGVKKNLHGCWAILPPSCQETPAPNEFVKEMIARRIVAAIAFPNAHNYSLSEWSIGPILAALESRRIPLLLPFGQFTWEEIDALCRRHPLLPLITTGINYRQLRFLLPLWERYRNLFVDIAWFSIHNGLSYLTERGMLRQLVFGTNYPIYDPGAAISMVTFANIDDHGRQMVASGTLRDILRGIRKDRA